MEDEDDDDAMFVDASDGGAGSSTGGVAGSSDGGVAGSSDGGMVGSNGGVVASPRGKKRKRGDATTPTKKGDGDPPSSKRGKVECKFGPKCYQTNQQHREQYLHPWVSQRSSTCKKEGCYGKFCYRTHLLSSVLESLLKM